MERYGRLWAEHHEAKIEERRDWRARDQIGSCHMVQTRGINSLNQGHSNGNGEKGPRSRAMSLVVLSRPGRLQVALKFTKGCAGGHWPALLCNPKSQACRAGGRLLGRSVRSHRKYNFLPPGTSKPWKGSRGAGFVLRELSRASDRLPQTSEAHDCSKPLSAP